MHCDEQFIRHHLTEQLEEGETLLYLSIPRQTSPLFPFLLEVAKGAVISAGVSLVVFLSVWGKYHNFDAARNCAIWGYLVFLGVLLVHSIFYYRQNSRSISAITDRAILRFDYKGALTNLNADNSETIRRISLRRIPFDTIQSVTLFQRTDKSGDMLYSLKGPATRKLVQNISVSDIDLAREAMPENLLADSPESARRLGGNSH